MSESREELESRIAAYIDGQLPATEAARLEVFLANTDPRLAEEIIGMLADRHHVRTLPHEPAPPDIAARIMEQVERSTLLNDTGHVEHLPRPWWQSRAIIAAGFILLVGGFAVFVTESVFGPAHENKLNQLALRSPTKSPVTSSPSTERALAMGPMAVPPAMVNSRRAAADDAKKMAKIPDITLKSIVVGGKAEEAQPPEAKAEAALQSQLVRNETVLNGGQVAAAKMGYAAVNSPLRALANITAAHSSLAADPVVVTLVARNSEDFSRLRSSLEAIMANDPAVAERQSTLRHQFAETAGNGEAIAITGAPRNDGEPLKQDLAKTTSDSNDTKATATQALGDKVAGDAAKDAEHQRSAGSRRSKNVDLYKYYSASHGAFDGGPEKQVGPTATTSPTAAASHAATAETDRLAPPPPQAAAAVVHYRVALHPQQLEELAREFQVDSITSGRQAFVITPDTDDRPVAQTQKLASGSSNGTAQSTPPQLTQAKQAPQQEQKNLENQQSQQDQLDMQKQNNSDAPTGNIVVQNNELLGTAPAPSDLANNSPAPAAPAMPLAPAPVSASRSVLAPKDAPWVEVIITMQEAPANSAATQQ